MKFFSSKVGRRPTLTAVVGKICFALLILGFGTFVIQQIIKQPNVALLFSEHGAEWIRLLEPFDSRARSPRTTLSIFRVRFDVNQVPRKAVLKLRAMKIATVWLDNQLFFASGSSLNNWKNVHRVDFTPILTPGRHELKVEVLNQNAHPALLAYCESLNLFSGEGWEASRDGKTWTRAMSVNEKRFIQFSRKFQRADRAFYSNLHVFFPIFVIIFIFSLFCSRKDRYPWTIYFIPKASNVRWILLAAWVVLASNNIGKIPLKTGMDIEGHIKYILYVVDNYSIPLPSEGWQMFQAPFFYMISAIICKFSLNFFSVETVARILRVLPLICGATQIELSYRALRYVYPKRHDLQSLGTIVGGLLPMNIYISQVVGNEPLAGCLSAVVIVIAFRHIFFSSSPSTRSLSLMGLFLGLAILTKTTASLLVPPLIIFITYAIYRNASGFSIAHRTVLVLCRMALLFGVAFLVAGWYYVRNWVEFGKFFVSGWDPLRNIVWWQDPAYRTPQDFITFGQALFYPIYSAFSGFWDSLYSTMWLDGFLSGGYLAPWNYGFVLSSSWLSLLPAGAIVSGFLLSLRKVTLGVRQGLLFAVACILIYISAMLYIFLSLPIYSTAKATYTLGLIPCYVVLSAEGFDILTREPLIRAVTYGIVTCWAVSVYLSYFVL